MVRLVSIRPVSFKRRGAFVCGWGALHIYYLCNAAVPLFYMETHLKAKLAEHNVNATPIRTAVLGAFMGTAHSLSQFDVEEVLERRFDRTSIYRAIQLFEEHGIVHRVPHTDSVTKYALCPPDACGHHHHTHQHLHFYCQRCQNTFCLDELKMPEIQFPGFGGRVLEIEVLAKGVCQQCG